MIKEKILLNLVVPVSDLLFRTHLGSWYRSLKKMAGWSPERIRDWQDGQLRRLIDDAYRYSPYYRQLFDSLSLSPGDIRTAEDLEKIPPLTKEIIRDHFDEILLQGKKGLRYRRTSTGGSTGNPTRYVKDHDSWGFDNAFTILMWQQAGYRYGDKFLALGSSSILPASKRSLLHDIYYSLKGKIPFNAMNMSEERMDECIGLIKRHRIRFIYGYASSIYLLARYVEKSHRESELSIKACFPTSEILTDLYRSTIQRVFGCIVSDMYGAHDGGIVAHNPSGGFKVGYNCIVQTEGGNACGTALLTDVTSHSFPFIRYRLGDEVALGDGYNETYFNGQVLDKVIGRTSDVIRLENGRTLTGPGFTVLFSKLNVKGYRIYKSGPLEITVVVVKDPHYSDADTRLIVDTMHKHAGDDCKIVVGFADAVETRKNGKNLYFLNDKD